MNIQSLFKDEDAVSPVIGVILMVAITVILAAVIGAFVLGIGGSQTQTPQASWSWESTSGSSSEYSSGIDCSAPSGSGSENVKVTHQGGDEIQSDNLELGDGTCGDTAVTAGSSLYRNGISTGQISLVWKSPSSSDTSILTSYDV